MTLTSMSAKVPLALAAFQSAWMGWMGTVVTVIRVPQGYIVNRKCMTVTARHVSTQQLAKMATTGRGISEE